MATQVIEEEVIEEVSYTTADHSSSKRTSEEHELYIIPATAPSAHASSAASVEEANRGDFTSDEPEDNMSNVVEAEDVPPNGGYGWLCTLYVFLINAHTWGINSAWAIFLAHYLDHSTFPEATRFDFALIGGLSIAMCCVATPAISLSNAKLGAKPSLLIGTLFVSAGLLGASFATRIWHLYLTQGVCFGWGMGFLYITATSILPQWFSSKRSLAMGLASSGAGLGGLTYNLGTARAIETLGLPWAYRILAACSLAVNVTASTLLRDRNTAVRPRQQTFNYREYTRAEVLLITAWGVFTELGYIALLFSLPNYAASVGLSYRQGSVISALLNLSLGVGRPLVGWLSDAAGRINVAAAVTLLCGVLCVALWVPAQSYGALLAFALLVGMCCGVYWNTVAPVIAEVVGLQRLPSSFSMICLVLTFPAAFAEPIALEIVSRYGYTASKVFVGCMFVGGAMTTWLLRSWKIHDVEQKAFEKRLGASSREDASGVWFAPKRLFAKGKY